MHMLRMDNGMCVTFMWQTNMSGHQILTGTLEDADGKEVKFLSWEIGPDDNGNGESLSDIEQDMLDELTTS